ncbi:hypothetical protein X874_18470 [Mannheimia varigena USDA-ARS-USMARC-1312]|nr:hypothetical protein X874_18470 [Mannheimia varigena USDA-ARS-USMARC-1312]
MYQELKPMALNLQDKQAIVAEVNEAAKRCTFSCCCGFSWRYS